MITRTLAVATLALVAAASTGCKNNDARADNNSGTYANNRAAHNKTCPLCGMNADASYTAWSNGSAVNCCSQECCDKFNGASDSDKQEWMRKANRGVSPGDGRNSDPTFDEARVSTFPTHANTGATAGSTTYPSAQNVNTTAAAQADRPTTTTYEKGDRLNRTCPITGKSASDRYTFVDADGTRIAFSSQEAADQYMSYGPEHRAEVRSSMRQ